MKTGADHFKISTSPLGGGGGVVVRWGFFFFFLRLFSFEKISKLEVTERRHKLAELKEIIQKYDLSDRLSLQPIFDEKDSFRVSLVSFGNQFKKS